MHSRAIRIRSPECNLKYVGSANVSASAWGKLVRTRMSQDTNLNLSNWECVVVSKETTSPVSSSINHRSKSRIPPAKHSVKSFNSQLMC